MANTMVRIIHLLVLVCVSCNAHYNPEIRISQLNRKKLSIGLEGVPGTDRVDLWYSLRKISPTVQEILRSGNVGLQQKATGYFSTEIQNEVPEQEYGVLEYSIKCFSNKGHILCETNDNFVIAPTVSLSPRLVRRGTTILHDDFTSNTLDLNKWWFEITCHGGGSGQFQMYTPDAVNTFIRNGILYLKPTFTADKFGENFLHHGTLDVNKEWGSCTYSGNNGCHREGALHNIPPIMSTEIHSKVKMTHGKVEVVAQIPKGDWLWPAIWLRAEWPWTYGKWPASGEIDIMEARGNDDLLDNHGNDKSIHMISSTIHWGASSTQHKHHGEKRKSNSGTTWGDAFHKYTLDWTADHIRMDVDDQPIMAWTTPSQGYWDYSHLTGHNIWSHGGNDAPFDSKMGLILNIAVGATNGYFPDSWHNSPNGKPWKNTSPTAMMDFWKNRHQWQTTWKGDDVAMKVKSVTMIQY